MDNVTLSGSFRNLPVDETKSSIITTFEGHVLVQIFNKLTSFYSLEVASLTCRSWSRVISYTPSLWSNLWTSNTISKPVTFAKSLGYYDYYTKLFPKNTILLKSKEEISILQIGLLSVKSKSESYQKQAIDGKSLTFLQSFILDKEITSELQNSAIFLLTKLCYDRRTHAMKDHVICQALALILNSREVSLNDQLTARLWTLKMKYDGRNPLITDEAAINGLLSVLKTDTTLENQLEAQFLYAKIRCLGQIDLITMERALEILQKLINHPNTSGRDLAAARVLLAKMQDEQKIPSPPDNTTLFSLSKVKGNPTATIADQIRATLLFIKYSKSYKNTFHETITQLSQCIIPNDNNLKKIQTRLHALTNLIGDLDPLIKESKPFINDLRQFSSDLRGYAEQINLLQNNPNSSNQKENIQLMLSSINICIEFFKKEIEELKIKQKKRDLLKIFGDHITPIFLFVEYKNASLEIMTVLKQHLFPNDANIAAVIDNLNSLIDVIFDVNSLIQSRLFINDLRYLCDDLQGCVNEINAYEKHPNYTHMKDCINEMTFYINNCISSLQEEIEKLKKKTT